MNQNQWLGKATIDRILRIILLVLMVPLLSEAETISQTSTNYGIVFGDSSYYQNISAAQTFKPKESGKLQHLEFYFQARSWDTPSPYDKIECVLLDKDWLFIAQVSVNGFQSGNRWLRFNFSGQNVLLGANQTYIAKLKMSGSTYALRAYKDVYPDGVMYWARERFGGDFRAKALDLAFKMQSEPLPSQPPCPENRIDGNVTIQSIDDLEYFSAYTTISGNLTIDNSLLSDIENLQFVADELIPIIRIFGYPF